MGSFRAKRAHTAAQQLPNKRLKTSPNEEGTAVAETDMLQMLPPELLLLVVGNLTPRECQPLRLTCKALRDVVDTTVPDTLTVTNDIAQYLLLEQLKHSRSQGHVLSNGWVAGLLGKFPRIKKLDVKCSQSVLTTFARHMVRDCLGSAPPGSVPLSRVFDLAENVKTNSRRHSAVLLCELIKFKVAQSLMSKPPGYEAMKQDGRQSFRADQLLAEHRIELQARVIELVEKVLTLKGHVDARAHEHYKYARDTLDDSLLQLVSCLQPRHSKYAYQLLAKAADPAKAARGWRWLFYFLARQKQAEAAIEAYKVVDKQALAQLSPTCLSELFRSLIDNEINTQPEPKLRAITSESGSWTKFLYRGNFTLTSTQSREGALEKVAADLICRDYLETAVNVMNRFETESTAMEIWVQLLGALGIVPGGEMPLVARDLHRIVSEQVSRAAALAMAALPARRVACHVPLVEVLVAEGHLEEAFQMVGNYPEQGALDKYLLRALSNALSLADCPPEQLSAATCDLLLDVLQHRLRDVATRSELTTILVAAYAARKELQKAVELASSLDAAAAAAMEADVGAAGGPAVEPVPAAAAAGAGMAAAGAPGPVGDMVGALGADGGEPAGPGTMAGQRIAEMWRGVATAAIRQGDAGVLLTALPRVSTSWLLGPVDEEWGPEQVVPPTPNTDGNSGGAAAGELGSGSKSRAADAGPSSGALAGAGPSGSGGTAATVPGSATATAGTAEAVAAIEGAGGASGATDVAGAAMAGGSAASPAVPPPVTFPSGPSTVWQRVCGVLLRAGRRADLESALLQLLAERRRVLGGHADQRALLEATARAMLFNGFSNDALALARRLGGVPLHTATQARGCCSAAGGGAVGASGAAGAPPTAAAAMSAASAREPDPSQVSSIAGVRPCWCMLNILLEGYMSAGQLEVVLQELLAAGAAESKEMAPGGRGCTALLSGQPAPGIVCPAAAGRLRQGLLTDVLSSLIDAGRPAEAVNLLRVLRGGENDGPMLPPPVPLPPPLPTSAAGTGGTGAAGQRGSAGGRAGRSGRGGAASKRNRGSNNNNNHGNANGAGSGSAANNPNAAAGNPNLGSPGTAAALAAALIEEGVAAAAAVDVVIAMTDASAAAMAIEASGTGGAGPGAASSSDPSSIGLQPQYSRLHLEGSGDEEAGQAAGAGGDRLAASCPGGGVAKSSSGPGPSGGGRATSLEAALAALVKALQKRASAGSGGSATASGSSAGSGGAGGTVGGSAGGEGVDLLADWLEVCKAWPLGPSRDAQLDALARRAMDKGRDLDIALQAGWLLGEAAVQELRFAYTHRDLAQKCISQGMLDAAQACLLRIKPVHWDAGDATARELMRAMARAGDKNTAIQLASAWIASEDQRADFIKVLRSTRPTGGSGGAGGGGAGGGSRAGSSSRGSSRD